jgi:hypothetical protein
MALPNKIGVPYVILGKDNGTQPLIGSIFGSPVVTGLQQPSQPDFTAYQWYYPEYGANFIAVVTPAEGVGPGLLGIKLLNIVPPFTQSYPDNITSQYNPGPPLYEPAPDPNGGTHTDDVDGDGEETNFLVYPRLESETPYDLSLNLSNPFCFSPGFVFEIPVALDPTTKFRPFSIDFEAPNFESNVYNEESGEFEFYPFAQATTTYRQTQSFKVTLQVTECCWNEGTTISGTVFFSKAYVDMQPNKTPLGDEWGWQGASGEMPEGPYDPAGSAEWEITIGTSLESEEIEIPLNEGNYVTFINDICVTSVTPPA